MSCSAQDTTERALECLAKVCAAAALYACVVTAIVTAVAGEYAQLSLQHSTCTQRVTLEQSSSVCLLLPELCLRALWDGDG